MTRKKELQPLGKQQPQGTVIPLREYLGTGDEHQAAVKWEKASTSGWRLAVPAFVIKTWSPQGKILVRFCCIKPARKLLSANEGSFSFGLHQVDFEKEHDSCPSLTWLFGNFVPGVHTALEIQVATVNTESTVGIYCLPKRQVHQLSRFLGSGSGILESTFLYQRPSQTYQCCRRKWGKLVGVHSWDAHLKMLHSGSILRMVGSSTYSYCSSWCILALSTLTDTFTFSKPSSEAVVLQTMCLVDLLWAEASKCKPGSASSKSIVPITAQLKSSDLSLFPVKWRSSLQEYAGNSVTRSAEEVTLPFHWFKQNHKSHLYSGLRI